MKTRTIGTAVILSFTAPIQPSFAQDVKASQPGFPDEIVELLYNKTNGQGAVENITGKMTPGEKSSFLSYCIESGMPGCLDLALSIGADANAPVGEVTPLAMAIERGNPETVARLVAAGADRSPEAKGNPLNLAIESGNTEIIRSVAENPADVGKALTLMGAETGRNHLITQGLALGAPATAEKFEDTPLVKAITNENIDGAQLLLENGAKASLAQGPALQLAIATGQVDMAAMLIKSGADPNTPGPDGSTPLSLAAAADSLPMVGVLLSLGADPKQRNLDGTSPAEIAAVLGRNEISLKLGGATGLEPVDILGPVMAADPAKLRQALEAGGDPNAISPEGYPILQIAVASGNIEMVKSLLDNGADPTRKARDGSNVMHLLCGTHTDAERLEITGLLIAKGAESLLTEPNDKGRSPIVAAAPCAPWLQLLKDKSLIGHADEDGTTLAIAAAISKNITMLAAIERIQVELGDGVDLYATPEGISMGDIMRINFLGGMLLAPNDRPIRFNARLVPISGDRPGFGLPESEVIAMQTSLKEWGYYSGKIDGDMGAGTATALAEFLQNRALELDISRDHLIHKGLAIQTVQFNDKKTRMKSDSCEISSHRDNLPNGVIYGIACKNPISYSPHWTSNGVVYLEHGNGKRELIITGQEGWSSKSALRYGLKSNN
ncbi:Putative peptidoglycan binding domain-containing protein [Paracoccus laeviglucosivorans]|uniref:Peptidoglycan binding domain-containing protein n=2 Tax=Paracoccus laeviglucosivorans TaxID=1197861 RepID=A0A521FV19_9RHOB|nr:Putative peptidoglycan binding domain-containing protein [Paracoccus laeviglucosivorans]